MIAAERRRWVRHAFFAPAEITEPETRYFARARTSDLSRGGCYIDMMSPLFRESALEVRITHGGEAMDLPARVVHSERYIGMGLRFDAANSSQTGVLDRWLAGADA